MANIPYGSARATTTDAPMGSTKPKSKVLSPAQQAVIVEFKRRNLCHSDSGHAPSRHQWASEQVAETDGVATFQKLQIQVARRKHGSMDRRCSRLGAGLGQLAQRRQMLH